MFPSWLQILVVVLLVVLLFGRGKISGVMGDIAQGIKSFKKGMAEDEPAASTTSAPPKAIDHQPAVQADVRPAESAEKKS